MMNDHDRPSGDVRRSWLIGVVRELQMAVGRMSTTQDPDDIRAMLNSLARLLPAPANHLERTILHGMLLDVACRCGQLVPTDTSTDDRHPGSNVRLPAFAPLRRLAEGDA